MPLLVVFWVLCVSAGWSWADDLGGSVLRDYPSALTLPKGRGEIGVDYLMDRAGDEAGDLRGARLFANYGLERRTAIISSFGFRDLAFDSDNLGIVSADLSLRRNLIQRRYGWIPKVACDVGLRADFVSGGGTLPVGIDSDGGRISIEELQDATIYLRATAGQIYGSFFPNLFVEYGHSEITGAAEVTASGSSAAFREDMDRGEDYLKVGASILIKFPYKALLHLEYDYLTIFRGDHLDAVDDNHLLKADLNYYLTPSLSLNLGGQYAYHHFNGEIPLLYQDATRSIFEEDYSYFKVGLTYLFGGM